MLRTLIVEDNVLFRKALKETLLYRFPAMTIEEASDGEEAMRKMLTFDPEVVFVDICLPGMNGFETTRRIKGTAWSGTIIMLTSHELPEYRTAAYSCGADHFLTKNSTTGNEIASLIESLVAD
ncbi:response regulator transcription factor [Desulfoferrobacter suflitae]|uniref:response regulator transcription factor n=1 Tax=Desulfoferrobacter suflitae TaxID=2865782 RepID=UPI0021642470|nr:response regulator [Desulfoferrobacter suflitae]MCK8602815.1 response regulator [Desulfoferrobacter suflitae]